MKTFLLAGLASLLFPISAGKSGALPDITKPYLGEYECKIATLGEIDLTEKFDDVILELCKDGSFSVRAKDKSGSERMESGKYAYDREKGILTFTLGGDKERKAQFPLEKGKIYITIPFGSKTMRLEFEQK